MTDNHTFESFKKDFIALSVSRGLVVIAEKSIDYGTQLVFRMNNLTIPVNLYYSVKKGFSIVPGGSANTPLLEIINFVITDLTQTNQYTLNSNSSNKGKSSATEIIDTNSSDRHFWQEWIGTDESGKGDYFGPLVVSGFVVSRQMVSQLEGMGICDSKKLRDKEIFRLAHELYHKFADRAEVLVLKPETYNKLYEDFRQKGKKTNEMMGWMHGRLILNLHKRRGVSCALVDKFAAERIVTSSLIGLKDINIVQRVKAESDIAVAAASVLARYHFLIGVEELSRKFGINLPKGSSAKTIETGKVFVNTFSPERLNEVAKINFRTTEQILTKKT